MISEQKQEIVYAVQRIRECARHRFQFSRFDRDTLIHAVEEMEQYLREFRAVVDAPAEKETA